jgi:hypothetical protein
VGDRAYAVATDPAGGAHLRNVSITQEHLLGEATDENCYHTKHAKHGPDLILGGIVASSDQPSISQQYVQT